MTPPPPNSPPPLILTDENSLRDVYLYRLCFIMLLSRSGFRQISGRQSRNNKQNPCEVSGRGAAEWVPAGGGRSEERRPASLVGGEVGEAHQTGREMFLFLWTETSTDSPAVVPPPKATRPLTSCTALSRLCCTDTVISSFFFCLFLSFPPSAYFLPRSRKKKKSSVTLNVERLCQESVVECHRLQSTAGFICRCAHSSSLWHMHISEWIQKEKETY